MSSKIRPNHWSMSASRQVLADYDMSRRDRIMLCEYYSPMFVHSCMIYLSITAV